MGKDMISPAARGLTRSQVADILGVTDRDVARMDGRQLHPTRTADRAWRYDAREVRAYLVSTVAARIADVHPEADGDTTAAAFTLFQTRKATASAVIELRQPVSVVLRLREQYDEMRGSLTLPASVLAELRACLEQGFSTPRALVKAVREALEARFDEGRAEAQDCGAVLDPATGKLRPVMPRAPRAPEPHGTASAESLPSEPTRNTGVNPGGQGEGAP